LLDSGSSGAADGLSRLGVFLPGRQVTARSCPQACSGGQTGDTVAVVGGSRSEYHGAPLSAENRLPPVRLAALTVGDEVTMEVSASYREPERRTGTVVRVTATEIFVRCTTRDGVAYQERYSRREGVRLGGERAELVNPERDNAVLRKERSVSRIDALFRRWRRDPDDLEALRRLRDALNDYLQDHLDG
jgi:hypothetical protein